MILDWQEPAVSRARLHVRLLRDDLRATLDEIRAAGLLQGRARACPRRRARTWLRGRDGEVVNFCANNYLGLADHPELVAAAHEALERWGFGLASVRFICGTQEIHKHLEARVVAVPRHRGHDPVSSCFDANGGLFETLLTDEDAVISDALKTSTPHEASGRSSRFFGLYWM